MRGWSFAATYGEVMAGMHFAAFLNSHRDKKDGPADVPFPWTASAPQEQVTDLERTQLREQLRKRSAFQH